MIERVLEFSTRSVEESWLLGVPEDPRIVGLSWKFWNWLHDVSIEHWHVLFAKPRADSFGVWRKRKFEPFFIWQTNLLYVATFNLHSRYVWKFSIICFFNWNSTTIFASYNFLPAKFQIFNSLSIISFKQVIIFASYENWVDNYYTHV